MMIILMESIHRLSRVVALRAARGHPGGQSSLSPTLGSSHHRKYYFGFSGKYSKLIGIINFNYGFPSSLALSFLSMKVELLMII